MGPEPEVDESTYVSELRSARLDVHRVCLLGGGESVPPVGIEQYLLQGETLRNRVFEGEACNREGV